MQIINQASLFNIYSNFKSVNYAKICVIGGGDKKIMEVKTDFNQRARSKVGSRDNVTHKPGGGDVKVRTISKQKIIFNQNI